MDTHRTYQNVDTQAGKVLLCQLNFRVRLLTEMAIAEGFYPNAYNLLKQELEILTAIEEFVKEKRKENKTPNPKNKTANFGRISGILNQVAHPTKPEIVKFFVTSSDGEHFGPTTIPEFRKEICRFLLGWQTWFLADLFNQMRPLFFDSFGEDCTEEEAQFVKSAIEYLIDEKIIKKSK